MAAPPRAAVRRRFDTPPEVLEYFEGKTLRPAFSWLDVWAEEHAHAFTVAKATETELLGAFRRTIGDALRDGQTFATWRARMLPELARLGWAGPRRVDDPTGRDKPVVVDFSGERRLRTIFRANMRSARAAGQWARIERVKAGLPYLLYVRTAASDPRPEHLKWAGIILPVDHPWWRSHFPPNGWGCQCSVRQITAAERDRLLAKGREPGGLPYLTEPPDDGPPVEHVNRRTGARTLVPRGIDPGWHTNPGLARWRPEPGSPAVTPPAPRSALTFASDVSATFREALTEAWAQIPEALRDRLRDEGISIVGARRLTDGAPELAGLRPRGWPEGSTWDNVRGGYIPGRKLVVVAETYVDRLTGAARASETVAAVLRHEIGHAFDAAYGYVSRSQLFRDAYAADVSAYLAAGGSPSGQFAYFLQPGEAGPSEMFAEIFAQVVGEGTFGVYMLAAFPRVADLMRRTMRQFER